MLEPMSGTRPAYNPHVQRVLESYQSAAEASLSGPSRFMAVWGQQQSENVPQTAANASEKRAQESLYAFRKAMLSASLDKKSTSEADDELRPTAAYFPVPHVGPLLLTMDNSHGEKSETVLEGVTISCFIVGGEKRLCLPQILNTVLQNFTLQQINAICDELHIFCSRCNPQQLELLKVTGVLPPNAPSCGLITKTDAERLCNALLYGSPEKSKEPATPNSFKVYHECFGKCKGVLSPELYVEPEAKCIKCCHCQGMFSPRKFVVHSHRALEKRTCHWGFDSANWRSYILLAKDQDSREHMQRALDEIKEKFEFPAAYKKRRELSPKVDSVDSKRARFEENGGKDYEANGLWPGDYARGVSAFRPWSFTLATLLKEGKLPAVSTRDELNQLLPPYLQTGPPVLLNPERVVPFTDTKRYDRHFAPNVSLAPNVAKDEIKGESGLGSPCQAEQKRISTISSCTPVSSSSSSLSSSGTLSPSPVKMEKNCDIGLITSEEFTKKESVASSPRDDCCLVIDGEVLSDEDLAADRKRLFCLVQQALDMTADGSEDDCDRILKQVAEICSRHDSVIHVLKQDRKQLMEDFDKLRKERQEHLEEVTKMRQLMKQLQADLDSHAQAMDMEKRRLVQEVEQARTEKQRLAQEVEQTRAEGNAYVTRIKAKYKGQIEMLRSRVEHYEQLNTNMAAQISKLQERLGTLAEDPGQDGHTSHSPAANKRHNGSFPAEDNTTSAVTADVETAEEKTTSSEDGGDVAASGTVQVTTASETAMTNTWAAKTNPHSKDNENNHQDLDT